MKMFIYLPEAKSMKELCDRLKERRYLKSDSVYKAMMQVDRADFTRIGPYEDRPQPINYNVTISAPHMHAYCLELLKDHLKEGGRALDVGFGSGYLTVAMSKMIGDKGVVVGIEHIKELCDFAKKNISKNHKHLLDSKNLILIEGDGREGYSECAPYNCIHVGAAAETIPPALVEQLANGGRLVIPVGHQGDSQYITIVDKDSNGKISTRRELEVSYVPLTSIKKQLRGY
jgi:protein-L-isoaspartate(D-aspartate) O-methyltransferase